MSIFGWTGAFRWSRANGCWFSPWSFIPPRDGNPPGELTNGNLSDTTTFDTGCPRLPLDRERKFYALVLQGYSKNYTLRDCDGPPLLAQSSVLYALASEYQRMAATVGTATTGRALDNLAKGYAALAEQREVEERTATPGNKPLKAR